MCGAENVSKEEPILLYFHADWCGSCQTMEPLLEKLESDCMLKIQMVDIDELRVVVLKFGIRSVPAYILMRDGKPCWHLAGIFTVQELTEKIRPYI